MSGRYIRSTIGLLALVLPSLASAATPHTMDCTKPPYGDSQDNYQQFILNGELVSRGNLKIARAIAGAEALQLQSACNAKYLHRGTARYATMGLSMAALRNYTVTQIATIAARAMVWKNEPSQRPQAATVTPATATPATPTPATATPATVKTQPGRISPLRGADVPPRSVTVQQFENEASRLASEGAKVVVSGAYLGEGDGGYLYASAAAIQTENVLGGRVPSIPLLTRGASRRAHTRFNQCSADAETSQNGCAVTIEGVVTTCQKSYLVGAGHTVPCLEVRDVRP